MAGSAQVPIFLAAGLVLLGAAPALGQRVAIDHAREYRDCMVLARAAPEDGFESALAWAAMGGSEGAKHCAAVALIGLGHYAEAARRLERLAAAMRTGAVDLRACVLAQAGQAWLLAEDTGRAYAVQSAALAIDRDNVELLLDRGITLATAKTYWEAVDDLNRALDLAPGRPDLLVLRASAYRYLDALELARHDIARAGARPGQPGRAPGARHPAPLGRRRAGRARGLAARDRVGRRHAGRRQRPRQPGKARRQGGVKCSIFLTIM